MVLSWAQLERHLGTARLAHYMDQCNGNQTQAIALYRWNASLSAAFWLDLGHLEVAFRNALDIRMAMRSAERGGETDWLADPRRELGRDAVRAGRHRQPYTDIHTARGRVRNNQKPSTHDQIISETSFGRWHQLVSRSQMFLWPDLAGVFPFSPDRAQPTIADPVSRLRHFRNPIAHHHRIWSMDGVARYQDILAVAGYIDPDLSDWIDDASSVRGLLDEQP